jgi:hypothetical protein
MPHLGDFESLINCVVFLYRNQEEALRSSRIGGTGFIVQLDYEGPVARLFGHQYLITNWHVAVRSGYAVARINRIDGRVDVLDHGSEDWFFIPGKHDIAVLPVQVINSVHKVTALGHSMVYQETLDWEPSIGDDVLMAGRFIDYTGHETNVPALRFGNISIVGARIKEPTGFLASNYVLDMHSRTGFSGSPVFVYRSHATTLARDNYAVGGHGFALLGINWGQFREDVPLSGEADLSNEVYPEDANKQYIRGLSGMTCTSPTRAIKEILELPKLRAIRAHKQAEAIRAFEKGLIRLPEPD